MIGGMGMGTTNGTERNRAYQCAICGYVYDPAVGDPERGIPASTPFEELPPDWVCPVCGAGRDVFTKVEPQTSQSDAKSPVTIKEYRNQDIVVYWNPQMCSHAGKCWGGLPEVFNTSKRPWVNVNGASAEEIIRTIDKCPTRALQYSLPEGSSVDPALAQGPGAKDRKIDPTKAGTIRVIRDGPLIVEGPNRVFGPGGELIAEDDRLVLCRCGKTCNPPFCDGSHIPGRH